MFHKDDLRTTSAGDTFGPALTEALGDGRTHVAVVLNAIDDRLAKEQKLGDATWRVDHVPGLRDLLRAAAEQGMTVLVTSDHGHVVDRHGTRIDTAPAEPAFARHRPPDGARSPNRRSP
ncbi:PglZ domain-containing protein [Streptomyces sp. C8S0]|uniref:PglZ domain-containing protein n=1 Tax=Streptomyces sp. C8S0 TaxID=2585716 RepID=UPI001D05AAF4|nr:PglZ domain-containing protein [Streptomyces sp. C8S0]